MVGRILKYKVFIIFFVIIVILMINSNSVNYSFNLNIDGFELVYLYIGLLAVGFIFLMIKLAYAEIYFAENEMMVSQKVFSLTIKNTKYDYSTIEKFIIGRIAYKVTQKYNLYIDQNNIIRKINSYNEYRECIFIINQIKEKTKKLVYDGTDEHYNNEEDLFRDYYKIKALVEKVKNEE